MRQAVRRRVVRFEMRYIPLLKKETRHAVLECGHANNLGFGTYSPKRMACWDCGVAWDSGSRR